MVMFSKDETIDLEDIHWEGYDFLEEGMESSQNQKNETKCKRVAYVQPQVVKLKFDWFQFGIKVFEAILLLTCGLLSTNFSRRMFDFGSTVEYLITISFSFLILNAIVILLITLDRHMKKTALAILNSSGAVLVSSCGGVTLHVWLFSTTASDDILVHCILDFLVALAYLTEVAANARSMASLEALISRKMPHRKFDV